MEANQQEKKRTTAINRIKMFQRKNMKNSYLIAAKWYKGKKCLNFFWSPIYGSNWKCHLKVMRKEEFSVPSAPQTPYSPKAKSNISPKNTYIRIRWCSNQFLYSFNKIFLLLNKNNMKINCMCPKPILLKSNLCSLWWNKQLR